MSKDHWEFWPNVSNSFVNLTSQNEVHLDVSIDLTYSKSRDILKCVRVRIVVMKSSAVVNVDNLQNSLL